MSMEYRCPHCNALIEGKTERCPLCQGEIKVEGDSAYPHETKRVKPYNVSFTLFYTVAALLLTLSCVVVNVYLHPSLPWWGATAVSLALIYFFVRHTLLGIRNLASKLIYISYAALTFIYALGSILRLGDVYSIAPYFAAAFALAVNIYVIATFNKSKGHLLAMLVGDVSCFIPLAIVLALKMNYIPSLVVASVAFVAMIVTLVIFGDEIKSELKRFFTA